MLSYHRGRAPIGTTALAASDSCKFQCIKLTMFSDSFLGEDSTSCGSTTKRGIPMNEIRYQQMEGKSPPRQVKVKYNNSQGHAAVESTVLLDPNTEMEAVGV